jgi:hypothetical protein
MRKLDIEGILARPDLLNGIGPEDLDIADRSGRWREEKLRRGGHAGEGWVLREYDRTGIPTGRVIRWHPGGGQHGPEPYWRVSDGRRKSPTIPSRRVS